MKQLRYWSFLPAFCLLALPVFGQGLELGSDTAKVGDMAEVPILLHNTDEVQGVVVALGWDGAIATGAGLVEGPVLTLPAPADADTVVKRVEADYAVLGVVMDSDGMDDEVIPPSPPEGNLLATLQLDILVADTTLTVSLMDGAYATVDGGPLLDNIVVVGGLSIGAGEGLGLIGGEVTTVSCLPRLYIGGAPGNATEETGSANVMLENCVPVEGYVTALCHDGAILALVDIAPGAAAVANGYEFSAADIDPAAGGTLAVIMDVDPPFDGQTLPVGVNQVAVYTYEVLDDTPGPTALTFCDNVLGDPLKENVFVAGGLSFDRADMSIEDGTFQVTEIGPIKPPAVQTFACGARRFGDALEGSIGGEVEICYHLLNPEDGVIGTLGQSDQVQGFSMALTYDMGLTLVSTQLDISDTILEALGAEFTSVDAGNGELIIAVLVDALPPFNGATIPPSADFQRMGCLVWGIANDPALCGTSLTQVFQDGVEANGGVPVRNLISVENVSSTPANFIDCAGADGEIDLVGTPLFYRGDCNFSNENLGREAVDIADAATVISYLFLPDLFKPDLKCLDSCDCNDDGRMDLADAMCILSYLYRQGPQPPAPGPGWDIASQSDTPRGEDPTYDLLGCDGGRVCR